MNMKWCCSDFESHLLQGEKRGLGLVVVGHGSKRGWRVQNWDEGSVTSHGGFAIKFCPWCGRNLREWFEQTINGTEAP
jgi:hypothetical protein